MNVVCAFRALLLSVCTVALRAPCPPTKVVEVDESLVVRLNSYHASPDLFRAEDAKRSEGELGIDPGRLLKENWASTT
eukprot:4349854-Lingulodinium_polyedra.AAC.1